MNHDTNNIKLFHQPLQRLLQLRIRSLLVIITIIAIFSSWYANGVDRQRRVLEWVVTNRGSYTYRYEYDSNSIHIPNAQPPGPNWLRNIIGVDFFSKPYRVTITDPYNLPTDIAPLGNLTGAHTLHLNVKRVPDLGALGKIKGLKVLILFNSINHELMPLANLKSLDTLYFSGSSVDPEKLRSLQLALPNCEIAVF